MDKITPLRSKIKSLKEFLIIKNSILKNKQLVFTNGCFDILHRGHIEYLQEAKTFGDILVIGLNSDSSVKKLKGEKRPINKEMDRAICLAALETVDYVIIFNEKTPYNLIKNIRPHVLIKGGDWREEEIVGYDIVKNYGGKVITSNFLSNYSTTKIIQRIVNRFCKNKT